MAPYLSSNALASTLWLPHLHSLDIKCGGVTDVRGQLRGLTLSVRTKGRGMIVMETGVPVRANSCCRHLKKPAGGGGAQQTAFTLQGVLAG